MSARPLCGMALGLSISESDDSTSRGFPNWQVNRLVLQAVAAFFGQGAGIVFGHDWREDGVMESIHGFALQVQPAVPLTQHEANVAGQPLLRNFIAWPDQSRLASAELERLSSTLHVETVQLPAKLAGTTATSALSAGPESPDYRLLRAYALTALRNRLDEECTARLCIGGRTANSEGFYPGIIEESLIALKNDTPLYLAGLLGGATRQVIDAIEGKAMPANFCKPNNHFGASLNDASLGVLEIEGRDPSAVWMTLKQTGIEELAAKNKLTFEENVALFTTPVIDRAIQLVLTGLSRLHEV